jgi:hypothetical protein
MGFSASGAQILRLLTIDGLVGVGAPRPSSFGLNPEDQAAAQEFNQ